MDKEILYINNTLVNSKEPLTTSEISKLIFNQYGVKISKTIVKNYLWSYFRSIIIYNSAEFTYQLNNDVFLIDDIIIQKDSNLIRPLTTITEGSKIKVIFDINIPIENYIQAIALINFKVNFQKNTDFLKQFNRIIEQINQEND